MLVIVESYLEIKSKVPVNNYRVHFSDLKII